MSRRSVVPLLLAIYLPVLLALSLPVLGHELYGIRVRYLFLDPATSVGAPFYLGLFSQLGALLWGASGAVCLFTAGVLRATGRCAEFERMLLCFGLLTALLTLDDLFLLHEEAFPAISVSERPVLIIYAVLMLMSLAGFRRTLRATENRLLLVALVLFGGSWALDLMAFGRLYELVPEDGLKFIGIVTWSVYWVRTSFTVLAQDVSPATLPVRR